MWDFFILDDNKKNNNNDDNVWNQNDKKSFNISARINDFLLWFQSVKTKEKVVFYRLLSTMTNAWMWLIKSVSVLEKQEKNPVFKKILARFIEELSAGKNLTDCMELYSNSFTEAEIWIIKSWEKTGWLNKVLSDLANQLEKVESISWKIRSAMMYPMFILIVVIWVVSVMMVMVVPKLLEIFSSKDNLPASTRVLISISEAFQNYWSIIIILIISAISVVYVWKKTPDWKYIYDNFLLKIPVFWWINQKLILSKFSRVLSGLLGSWVSVVESLNITSSAVWNEVYKQRILLLIKDVQQWIKIWESLDWDKIFPVMMVQMIQVWEQTAKLDQVIIKVADFYDEEVDNTIQVLNKLLEPFIIIILALIVWFIAIAIMQPIMNLADTISET